MDPLIRSLHHVTATVDDAQADLDFFARVLGLRLVKKTVNFDNPSVYHFYYGDERGTPGSLMTTFPYKGKNVAVGHKGAGQVTVTSFSVPPGSLDAWRERLAAHGVRLTSDGERFGDPIITFDDPSGLVIELVGSARDDRAPWASDTVGGAQAIRGLHGITMTVRDRAKSVQLLTEILGYEVVNEAERRVRLAVNGDRPGHLIDLALDPEAPLAKNGLGTVHHVAMAVSDADEQLRLRQELVRRGYSVTEVLDRQYFRSIYFREPGGVLFEVATIPPGFVIDEEVTRLGEALKLPPWEEPRRSQIEAALPVVTL